MSGGASFALVALLFAVAVGKDQYGIIVDAGSSGSRLFVYRWGDDCLVRPAAEHYQHKVKPGLSTFAGESEQKVAAYFAPLMRFADSVVPEAERSRTTFTVKATAGFRLLDIETARGLLKHSRAAVMAAGYGVGTMKVISGQDEGAAMWVTINQIKGTLTAPPEDTFGAIDLGGGSLQIAFLPKTAPPVEDGALIAFDGKARGLFVRSYLSYGVYEARYRMNRDLETAARAGERVAYPCLPTGYSKQEPLSAGADKKTIAVRGSSSFTGCMEGARASLKAGGGCRNDNTCLWEGGRLGSLRKYKFIGRDHFVRALDALRLPATASLKEIELATRSLCNADHKDFVERLGRDPEDECFAACYMLTVLREGFGFGDDGNLEFHDDINGQATSWTLGAMTIEVDAKCHEQKTEL